MTVTVDDIIPAKEAENVQTTQFTSTNVKTIIDKFTATNTSGVAITLSINLVTIGGAAGNDNLIVQAQSVAAGATYISAEIVGHTLDVGGFISTIASAATGLTIRASGRIVT